MDRVAEYGIASHWSYKENKDGSEASKDAMEQKLQIFRSIIELNNEIDAPLEFIDSIKKDVLTERSIYVYTPKGDVIELPEGATPIDFAYRVHSEIGNKMIGAIVNDSIVALNYKLKNGDIIKINTSKLSKGPNRDWLEFVATTQAKAKIKSFFNKINKDEVQNNGQEILEKELKKQDINIGEFLSNKNLEIILNEFKLKDIFELYNCLGTNKYSANQVIKVIYKKDDDKDIIKDMSTSTHKINMSKNEILVEGISEIKVSLSNCCKPVKGDDIIGYVTKGSGISVHRSCCHNISDVDERLISVKWNDEIEKKYFTDLLIYTNSNDILLQIITKASSNGIVIDTLNTVNKSDFKIYSITVIVENLEKLNKYINDLYNIKEIQKVERALK